MTDETAAQPGTQTAATQALAPAATETTADAGTLLGGDTTAETVEAGAPADWPADWRQKLAGEDKKTLERLGRMASPADLFKSYRALEQKVSAGELKKGLPENATPEQIAQWRKEQGLPEQPEGYLEKLALPDGVVLGEADKPMAAAFGGTGPAQAPMLACLRGSRVDDRGDKPSLMAPIFVFVTITVASVLTAVLIGHAVRALFSWIAG